MVEMELMLAEHERRLRVLEARQSGTIAVVEKRPQTMCDECSKPIHAGDLWMRLFIQGKNRLCCGQCCVNFGVDVD